MTQTDVETWRDPGFPVDQRVTDLLGRMTLEEKLAQLGSVWMGAGGDDGGVAPMQDLFFSHDGPSLDELIKCGMGQLTRVFGTRPVTPAEGMRALAALQARVMSASRFGIPAVAHEECLTGFAAWTATIFPTPLAWGASFDPALVRDMARGIGAAMHAVGVHQGLAPVLDVTRDPRWGRTEETIGEDPYLVGSIGTGYVQGLQAAGVQATLKHFAAYSASRAGRNMAPVSMGPRELADVILPPFEMAIRLGGARSVMPSYVDIDGVPASADPELLGALLRDQLGFDGLVVSDYYAVSFLELQHAVAANPAGAATLALAAGIDVELPTVRCYGDPLRSAVEDGDVAMKVVDRAVARVLRQKFELGMLDPGWSPIPDDTAPDGARIDLDPPAQRALARRLAEESVVLLANDGGALPLAPADREGGDPGRVAVIGPLADDPLAFFGCYTMPRHLASTDGAGVEVTTLLGALRAELPDVVHARGCDVRTADRSGFAAAVASARSAEKIVAVVGDEAGLFGRGTSGEGCDVTELRLPGVQEDLLHALADIGKPVVAVLVTGRPYAIGGVAGLRRHRAGVLSRRGGRPRDRRGAHRARDAERQAARRAARGAWRAAVYLPAVTERGRHRQQLGRPGAAVRVRARAVVHDVRLLGPDAVRGRRADRRRGGDFVHRPQHRRRRGDRGRAALPRRSRRVRGAAGALAGRVHPGAAGAWRGVPGGVPGARRPDLVHRPGRHPDRRAWRDHRGGRRGIRQPAADLFVHALRPVARGAGRPDPRHARDGA